ncbi:MAG: S-layer homology domain-containing protein [bacterium]|nr:S-layer homology domain-containing protein [bacterium]
MAKKKVTKTKAKKRKITSHDTHFLSVLLLFVGFSVYAISSFMNSTNNYIDQVLTDVLSSDGIVVQVDMDNPFSDVPGNAGYADAVIALYYDGVIGGYNDGTFRPDNSVTRAEFSKMLVEVNDFDYTDIPSDILSNCFTDVKDLPDHWYAPAVCAAKNQGWVKGYGSGEFGPNQNINKAEALTIVLNAFDFEVPDGASVEKNPYDDVGNEWFRGVAYSARSEGLIPQAGLFNAGSSMTRGEIARIIYKAMEAKDML